MGIRDALATSATIGQIFLIALNILFALLGICLVILGAVIRANNVVDQRIVNLLDKVDFNGLKIGDLLLVLSVFIIIIGIFTVLVAADGGFGACFRVRWLLIIYIIILAIIVLVEIVIFGLWCKVAFGAQNWLKEQFDRLFQFYNGIGQDDLDVYSLGWNLMFMLLDCCGSSPVTAFRNDFETSFWWRNLQRQFDVIPYTCCTESNVQNYKFGKNTECTQQMQYYRTRGCHNAFKQLMSEFSTPAIVISVIMIITQIIAIVSAVLMLVQIGRNLKRSVNMSSSNLYKQGAHDLPLADPKPMTPKQH